MNTHARVSSRFNLPTNSLVGMIARCCCIVLVVLTASNLAAAPTAAPTKDLTATTKTVTWFVSPDGRLLLMCEGDREVERRWLPANEQSPDFSALSVTEIWLMSPTLRLRAYALGGIVSAVTGWSLADGRELQEWQIPRPPRPVTAIIAWDTNATTADETVASADELAARVDAIIAEELADLDLLAGEATGAATGTLPTVSTAVQDQLTRSLKAGFTFDASEQRNSVPSLSSTTRNRFIEYSLDHYFSSDDVERTFNGRGSFGTTFDSLSVDYSVGSPAAAANQHQGGVRASFEGEKSSDPLAVDTLSWGLEGSATRVLNEKLELSANLDYASIDYVGATTSTFGSNEFNGEWALTHFGDNVETSAGLRYTGMSFPDDPAGDYGDFAFELAARGEQRRLDWDVALALTSRGYDDTDSISSLVGTTNDDYRDRELAVTAGWRFSERLNSELVTTWSKRSYDNPNDSNYDYDIIEIGETVDWEIGRGWSASVNARWTTERYRDRDSDDGSTTPFIREEIDDVSRRELGLTLLYSRGTIDLSLAGSFSRDHFPASENAIFSENVDSRSQAFDLSFAWRFAPDWTFDLATSRADDTYQVRPEDNTRADSLSASLTRKY